jgi:hypothetical protein
MIPQLITLEQAKAHSRITTDEEDLDIDFKVSAASQIVMDYLKKKTVPEEWVENHSPLTIAAPFNIQAAVCLVFGDLYENRESATGNPLSNTVMSLLERYRDPAFR